MSPMTTTLRLVVALLALYVALPQGAAACEFAPPTPLLRPGAYAGQSVEREPGNRLIETAQLGRDWRIEVRQAQCVDFVATEFILTGPAARDSADDAHWIERARRAIAGLKTRAASASYAELDSFLRQAAHLPERGGERALCRDGSAPAAGQCDWTTGGGFVLSLTRSATTVRVSARQYLSA